MLNSAFTPPLGDEFGHRYALKLYPFALLWLGTLLAGPAPARIEHLAPDASWEPVPFETTPDGLVLRLQNPCKKPQGEA